MAIYKAKMESSVINVVNYIGKAFRETPYLYLNVIKYGVGFDSVTTWLDVRTDGSLRGVYLLYYDCLHFFTRTPGEYPKEILLGFIKSQPHKVLMLQGIVGERIDSQLSGYHSERNHIIDMANVGLMDRTYRGEIADRAAVEEIVNLLISDSEYTHVYDRQMLLEQMLDRFDSGFSRYFVIRQDGRIVATCSTYGEAPGFAIVGGVMVHPECRRQGLACEIESYACHVLSKENITRIAFVNFKNTASLALHKKLGGIPIATMAKFIKREDLVGKD